jgi:hypothetical protein
VPAPDPFVFLPVLAYGPAPGLELLPYFFALLGWLGLSFAAILLAPFSALLRRLRRRRAGVRGQESGVRSQESGVGCQESVVKDVTPNP